jgi:two-component system, NarL family, sensor histidine kinase BarA
MVTQIDEKGHFLTLLAYANCSALPISPTQDLYGNSLVLADTHHEASTALANKLFNLALIDIDLNGLSLVSVAKAIGGINCHTPIIALVDKDDLIQRKQLISAGFDDCLLKPLTTSNLSELISFWRANDNVLTDYSESIQALLTKFRNNKIVVLAIYNKLFEELPQKIDQIDEALKTGKYQLAFDAAHNIDASAKLCHLKSIEELAIALQGCLNQKRYDLTEGYFSMLQHGINKFINHRQNILDYLD